MLGLTDPVPHILLIQLPCHLLIIMCLCETQCCNESVSVPKFDSYYVEFVLHGKSSV
jgi:hypothetical protein